MNILVTAGNTQTPIDQVRCITNIFTGRTGATIAAELSRRGHQVTLLTSQPETCPGDITPKTYRTFAELQQLMEETIPQGHLDAIIHSAAVSDYEVVGTYRRDGTEFSDVHAGKIKGNHPELWLKLVPTPKLVDRIRRDWGYQGLLVKFKLEVGRAVSELTTIAEASRRQSLADLIVANSFEERHEWALIGPISARYEQIPRPELARRLADWLEANVRS